MRSKNDYLDYLERRMSGDNYLAHYGVKGMKWKKHTKLSFTGDDNHEDSRWTKTTEISNGRTAYGLEKSRNIHTGETGLRLYKEGKSGTKYGNRITKRSTGYSKSVEIDTSSKRARKKREKIRKNRVRGYTALGALVTKYAGDAAGQSAQSRHDFFDYYRKKINT